MCVCGGGGGNTQAHLRASRAGRNAGTVPVRLLLARRRPTTRPVEPHTTPAQLHTLAVARRRTPAVPVQPALLTQVLPPVAENRACSTTWSELEGTVHADWGPPGLVVPVGHGDPVGDVAPGRHWKLAGARHAPVQLALGAPVTLPKRPTGHREHAAD
jgi:hypothetical protein